MSSAATFAHARDPGVLRTFFRQHPEWWAWGLCALGWWVMATHSLQFAAHGMHHRTAFSGELRNWLLMVAAMMFPWVARDLRAVAFASLWSRRERAMLGALLGYTLVWLLTGIPIASARLLPAMHTSLAPTIGFALAAGWQLTPLRAVAFAACHRSPLPAASGWRADRDCVTFGLRLGWSCVLTCGPLMLACAFSGHALVAMIGCMGLGFAERGFFRPRFGTAAVGAVVLAGYCLVRTFA